MELIQFPQQTTVYAKDQPQYQPLPAHVFPNDPQGRIAFCWKLNLKERLLLLFTGKLWHQVLTFDAPLQPQMLSLAMPKMKSRFRFRAWTFSRICVTWCIQGAGAPLCDQATVNEFTGRSFKGYSIIPFWKLRWKRQGKEAGRFRSTQPSPALVLAWEQKQKPAGTPCTTPQETASQ